jgi:hypothetical protein
MSAPTSKKKRRIRKRNILITIILLLVVARILLPFIVLHYGNKTLANMDGYYGHIDDITISLYRGAYTIHKFYINKVDSATTEQTPFISSEMIDLSVEWRALFKGRIVGELEFSKPKVLFTKDKVEPEDVQKDTSDFKDILDDFMPLKINRFEVNQGAIHYIDENSSPKVDLFLDQAHILAQNLSSVQDTSLLPSKVDATANVYGGQLFLHVRLNPLDNIFDLSAELKDTKLPEFNEFFQAYANMDVSKGTFGLYTEIASKKGKWVGYVKPVINDLKVIGPEDKDDKFWNKVWEVIVGAGGLILKNPSKDQVATKIPIEGDLKGTEVSTWYAIIQLLRNAFVQALYPAIDNEINLATLNKKMEDSSKNFFQRVFSKPDKEKQKKN